MPSSQSLSSPSFLRAMGYFRNLFLGIIAVGMALVFYLSIFPISLDFLRPFLVAQEKQLGVSFQNTHLAVTWRGWNRVPELEVSNMEFSFPTESSSLTLSLPKVYLTPYWLELLQGRWKLKSLVLKDPSIKCPEGDSDVAFSKSSLYSLLKKAFEVEHLKKIKALTIENPFPQKWPQLSLQLTRNQDTLHLDLRDAEASRVVAVFSQQMQQRQIQMEVSLSKVHIPSARLSLDPLGPLPPLSGKISGSFAHEAPHQKGTFLIKGESHQTEGLQKVVLEGQWDEQGLKLSQATLQKEGVFANLKGEWKNSDSTSGKGKLALQVKLGNISLQQLPRFWPEELAVPARTWIIQNITEGEIATSTLNLSMTLDEAWSILSQKLSGTLTLEGLTVHYLEGMPPVKKVRGTAVFSDKAFDINLASGILQSQKLVEGKIWITGLDLPDQKFKTNLKLKGPLSDLFEILAFPPLEYTQKISIPLDSMKASIETSLDISFPLEKDLRLSQVNLLAKGHLTNFSYIFALPQPSKPLRFERGDITLLVTTENIDLKGKALLDQTPVTVSWQEAFSDQKTRTITFLADMTPLRLNQWGINLEAYIQETFPLKLIYTPHGPSPLSFEANLSPVRLTIPAFNWTKEKGESAQLSGLIQTNPKGVQVQKVTLQSPEISLKGSLSLSPSYALQTLSFSEIKSPRNDCALHFEETAQGNVLTLKGASADLGGFLTSSKDTSSSTSVSEEKSLYAFLDIEKAYVGSEDPLYHLKGSLTGAQKSTGLELTKANMRAKFASDNSPIVKPRKGMVSLIIQNLTPQEQSFFLQSDNGGYLLKALGFITNVRGGDLKITASRSNPQAPLKGKVALEKFTVAKTPFLTQLLMTLASPTSFLGLFSNGKIDFLEFSCDIIWESPLLKIQEGLFQSLSSGISLDGTVNSQEKTFDLRGNLIPAYIINKPLSAIPIIGDILGGGKGDGIGATRFFVNGPIDNPSIRVNPLQILTPGIIKKLFSAFQSSKEKEGRKEREKEETSISP